MYWDLLRETFKQWREEDLTRLGAALAYYAAFSLIPLMLVVTVIAGLLFSPEQVENRIGEAVSGLAGQEATSTIRDALGNVSENTGSVTTIVSVIALLYGATGFFRHLKNTLNVIWNVPPSTPNKVRGFVRDTLLSLMLVTGLGIVLLLILVINAALFAFVRSLDISMPDLSLVTLWKVVGIGMLLVLTTAIFATIYKVMPDANVTWHDVWIGAVITAFLFIGGQFALGFFLSRSNLDSIYGTASVVMFILIWVYISSHIVLLGAEFTQVYANKFGSKIIPTAETSEVN